jgi:Uma2 family endonuclease
MLAEREPKAVQDGRLEFTFEMFEALSDAGHFADKHVELLDGEIFAKGMQSPRHAYTVTTLLKKLLLEFRDRATVASQVPLILLSPPSDFVEPDIVLRIPPSSRYPTRNANNADALLVVEISDSTLERDQTVKLRAYARNNVQDYWILNLHTGQLEVHREPSGEEYLLTRKHKPGQAVAPLAFADVPLEWW